jgi:hypothetical protein
LAIPVIAGCGSPAASNFSPNIPPSSTTAGTLNSFEDMVIDSDLIVLGTISAIKYEISDIDNNTTEIVDENETWKFNANYYSIQHYKEMIFIAYCVNN